MAEEPSKTPGTSAERPSPQIIPLSKIHDLPGVFIPKQPDKSYGGLVSSIQASGVKEPVILRLREDGEYQLVAGYRRRRGSELAKKQDIPAFVYEMTLQEAVDYHRRVQNQPALPIPGKLVKPTVEKKTEQPAPAAVSRVRRPSPRPAGYCHRDFPPQPPPHQPSGAGRRLRGRGEPHRRQVRVNHHHSGTADGGGPGDGQPQIYHRPLYRQCLPQLLPQPRESSRTPAHRLAE